MGDTLTVEISRHDPVREKDYISTYEINCGSTMTVLEVLEEIRKHHDSTLAFRSSCRSGKCGSCAVSLNGDSVLACRTQVTDDEISIAPLENFPVIKDLIVDKSQFDEGQKRALAYTEEADSGGSPKAKLSEEEIDYSNLSRCIGCMVCESVCPIAGEMNGTKTWDDSEIPDPSWLTTVAGSGIRLGPDDGYLPLEESLEYCSLCENCERACPSGVELSKLITRAKSAYEKERGVSFRDRLMTRPDYLGKLASLIPGLANRVVDSGLVRKIMEGTLNIDSRANVFTYSAPFERWFQERELMTNELGAERKVAYFVGCFQNYNETGPAKDLVKVLDRLGIYVEVPHQVCCGMPSLGKGDLDKARRLARVNLKGFEPYLEKGYDVVTTCTSGSLMLKEKYTEVLDLAEAEEMAESTYDLGEFLRKLWRKGEIEFELGALPGKTAYHTPCHLKSQNIGRPFIELLEQIPDFEVEVLDTLCCGLSGSYGYDRDKYEISQGVANDLYRKLEAADPDLGLSECGACQLQMEGGTGLQIEHPITILRRALEAG